MAEPGFTFAGEVRPVCEIGLSETRQAEPDSWLDVSCFVHEAELFHGRERFNERFEPGTASVTFANDDGWADLGGTYVEVAAAPLRPGRQIRVGVHGPWSPGMAPFVRWLYRGFIDQATPAYDPVRHDTVTVQCIDALGEAGQSVAPQGELQGVNEVASDRINRILGAVGWWTSKRKVDASPTTVQGTSLGGSAIDHMGQAADSAGGVVFGDLDGDVVFRGIDWMLYDPDLPPDGTIGPGEPGVPPGDLPPYIDPEPGAPFDPDDPPTPRPPPVCVCAEGTAGTLVEKGDNYRLYVKDGHLFYESSGHTWDLGPYSAGCVCVEPPGPGTPPVPSDPNDPGHIFPTPIELPPQFGVELLAWNDGGLADPPAASVTVAGVTPGHDCLLFVFVNALGSAGNTSTLNPTITGGGFDWAAHRHVADQVGDGAASFIALAPVGRTDPGTFSVVVTWAAGMTSRTHIVTVWKGTLVADDYLERFDAGLVLYATTDSNPPGDAEPGNGPQTVELAAVRQAPDVYNATRTVDITVAQSLAEESTGPFGAILAEGNGPWNYPPIAPPQPSPGVLADPPVCDDFERADGSLGAGWMASAGPGWAAAVAPMAIAGGAAVGTVGWAPPGSFVVNAAQWATPVDVAETVGMTVTVDGLGSGTVPSQEVSLMLRAGVGKSSQCAIFDFGSSFTIRITLIHFAADGTYGASPHIDIDRPSGAVGLGFESDPDGTWRVLVDDVVVWTDVDAIPIAGTYVGFALDYAVVSPRVLEACIGVGHLVRKASWVAGWRVGVKSTFAALSDVNVGTANIQSAQCCLVVESAEPEGGWRIIDYNLRADASGVTPAGTFAFDNAPRPGSLIVVFVGLTASSDVVDSISITGTTFTRAAVAHKTGSSWGQGAAFTAVAPLDFNPSSWDVSVNYPGCESVSAVVYAVDVQDDDTPVGGTAAGVVGTHTAGSVNGAHTISLSATGDAAAVVLAYLHVAADPSTGSGAAADEGVWFREMQYSPGTQRAYFQTMTREPGQPESTSTAVTWTDVQTGTAAASSAVELAVEVKPFDGLASTPGGSGVYLGGVTDAWNGTISSATAFDPVTGFPIWGFP